MSLPVVFHNEGVVEIDGVKMTYEAIKSVLRPPENCLFSVKRLDNELVFTTYGGAEAAAKFYSERLGAGS